MAQQAQHTAVAESRQQMAASQAALEEQVLALQEEVARRDALQEQFGVDEELAEGARQARAWEARCHLKQEEVDRLQDEAAAAQRLVAPQLRRCKGRCSPGAAYRAILVGLPCQARINSELSAGARGVPTRRRRRCRRLRSSWRRRRRCRDTWTNPAPPNPNLT